MKLKKADIVLVLALLLVAAAAGIFMLAARDAGAEAVVVQNGKEILRMPLNEDTEEVITRGEDSNTVVIKDGTARVTEANCPDKVCVHTGEIRYEGQTIVCLPHKLVVKIEGGDNQDVDAVAQ
ncbi:MAG: NusG domain II-containing protein [Firmicutes bacterium]|nr:NusG domain II-containing protein [Bacillota bacterium]